MKTGLFISFILSLTVGFTFLNFDNIDSSTDLNSEYKLVWSDEFEYSDLPDSEKWVYDTEGNEAGWGNNELQIYTHADRDNSWVKNGKLHITARTSDQHEKGFTSARLISNARWKYGIIEVNAKVPPARGTWSAIWFMPSGWKFSDGNWPDVGEIDIMEHVGHNSGVIHASAHSKDHQWQKNTQKTGIIYVEDVSEKFHSYKLDWQSDYIKAYVDDSLYFEYQNEEYGESKWPYDKPFSLILNVAVGGAWGIMNGVDTAAFPQTMEIDFVRVYQKQ